VRLHHIGVVVPSLENARKELTKFIPLNGINEISFIESQKVNVQFLNLGEVFLELIEPVGEASPVYKFAKNGGGFHHLCYEVRDINKKILELEKKGARTIVRPVKGFEDRSIAFVFLNIKGIEFNLIELAEERKN